MEKEGSSKKWVIRTIVLVLILAVVFVRFVIFSDSYHYDKVATSVSEINNLIDTAVSKGKGEIYFESAIVPSFLDFDAIFFTRRSAIKFAYNDGSLKWTCTSYPFLEY